jgi:hypothetical protein
MTAGRKRLHRRAAVWLLVLGPLFYASYGFANWWAGTRAQVPSVVFGWERHVPFWAWTIFPYWSLNLFYAASPFFAPSRHAMDRHVARLVTAQLVAVTCFVLWPLHFSFGRPEVSGPPAVLFEALRGFDRPYNQAPSLHIALAVVMWDWYRRLLAARPAARAALHAWTVLICGSVLTTYQHHFIDIPTGALVGLVCVWLWPLERVLALPRAWRVARDARALRLAAAYALGGALALLAALAGGGAWLWLAWPAASLAVVAAAYAGLGERGLAMDRRGRMGWAARWLLLPYRLGAAANAALWTRGLPASVETAPGLRIGRRPSAVEWRSAGCPAVVSLCAELQVPLDGVRCVPMLDLLVATPKRLRRAAHAIRTQRAQGRGVWVCCALGFSRSAAALVGLLASEGADLAAAEAQVRGARPQVVLGDAWRASLARSIAREARP